MKRISDFSKRLSELRIQRDATLDDFSRITQYPVQTLNRYERGERVPKVDVATEIAERLGVAPLWLFGYDVLQSVDGKSELVLSEQENVIIKKYRQLDPRGRLTVERCIDEQVNYINERSSAVAADAADTIKGLAGAVSKNQRSAHVKK